MAGMSIGGLRPLNANSTSSRYPGMTYNSALGGYTPSTLSTLSNVGGQVTQGATPTVIVHPDENPNTRFFGVNTVGRGGYIQPTIPNTGNSPFRSGSGSSGRSGGNAAVDALISQIQSSNTYKPAAPPAAQPARIGGQYDQAAEDAAYGRAKDRTGLAMQSAMKGLQAAMASRGIRGSTIERGGLENVFGMGLGELANTDRALAEERARRAFEAENLDLTRNEGARQYDASWYQNEAQREQNAMMQKLQQLISAYGLRY